MVRIRNGDDGFRLDLGGGEGARGAGGNTQPKLEG